MTDYATLIRTQRLVKGQGTPSEFGCNQDELPEIIAYAKRAFPEKPYCVVGNWTWVDVTDSDGEKDAHGRLADKTSIIYASQVIADEAHRPHLGPLLRTSPLCEFHRDCVFVTSNTVYILCGRGKRTSLSSALITGYIL